MFFSYRVYNTSVSERMFSHPVRVGEIAARTAAGVGETAARVGETAARVGETAAGLGGVSSISV